MFTVHTLRATIAKLVFLAAFPALLAPSTMQAAMIYVLKRGAADDNYAASIVAFDGDGNLVQSWGVPTTSADPNHIYLSSVVNRRYMSQSMDGNLLVFNGFGPMPDASGNARVLATFSLVTQQFESSTRFPTAGTEAMRSAATIDGSGFYYAGLTDVGGVRYIAQGSNTRGVVISSSSVARDQLRFYDGRLWVTREAASTRGITYLNTTDFPTEAAAIGLVQLNGTGWDRSNGGYRDFAFLDTTLFISNGDALNVFLKDINEEVFANGWNLLADDIGPAAGGSIVGVQALQVGGITTVFYNTDSSIYKVQWDPNAPAGQRFGSPVELAAGALGEGEMWGGMVAVPEPSAYVLLLLLAAGGYVLIRRRRGTSARAC